MPLLFGLYSSFSAKRNLTRWRYEFRQMLCSMCLEWDQYLPVYCWWRS